MAFFSSRPSLMIFCLVLMFLLFVASSYPSNTVVPVSDICKGAKNPSFCSNILNSKPGGTSGADLISLAQYTIDVVRGNTTNTLNLIKSLITKSGNDPAAIAHYKNCLVQFGEEHGVLGHIEVCEKFLKKRIFPLVSSPAAYAAENIENCISDKFPDKSNLPQYADVVDQVIYIIYSIAEFLMKTY